MEVCVRLLAVVLRGLWRLLPALSLPLCVHAQVPSPAPATVLDTRSLEAQVRAWATPATTDAAAPRVEVEFGSLDPRLRLAPCRSIEPHLPVGQRLWGRSRIGLRCTDGPVRWNVYLPVTVHVYGQALVATRMLPAGQEIGPGDVNLAAADWAAEPAPVILRPQDAIGRRTAFALQPGEALRTNRLQRRQWFSAGDPVRVSARGDGYAVSQQGVAMTPGIEGQAARIRTDNGKVLVAFPDAQGSASLDLDHR